MRLLQPLRGYRSLAFLLRPLGLFLLGLSLGGIQPPVVLAADFPPAPNPLPLEAGLPTETQTLIYTFVSARCPCSQAHEPVLAELAAKLSHAPSIKLIGIHSNANETEQEGQKRWRRGNQDLLGFPVVRDPGLKWADAFGAVKTPHVFVVDRATRKILYRGGVDDSSHPTQARKHYLKDLVSGLMAGQMPPFQETRALGCRIARDAS